MNIVAFDEHIRILLDKDSTLVAKVNLVTFDFAVFAVR